MRPLKKSLVLPFCLLGILIINIWSCWPIFKWPLMSVQAMRLTNISDPGFEVNLEFLNLFMKGAGIWRPAGALSSVILYQIFGTEPTGYYLVGYMVYILWGVGAFLLTRLLTGSVSMSIGTGLLLAFLPTRLPVMIVSSMRSFVSCAAAFGTFFLYLTLSGGIRNSWLRIGGGLALFTLSLLFREDSIIFWPALVSIVLFLKLTGRLEEIFWKKMGVAILISGLVLIIYMYVRFFIFKDLVPSPEHAMYPPLWDVFRKYIYAPLWLLQGFGFGSLIEQIKQPAGLAVLACGGILLCVFTYKTLSISDGTVPPNWKKKIVGLIPLSLVFYILGLFSTCYSRVNFYPGCDSGRLDIFAGPMELYKPFFSFIGLIWMVLGLFSLLSLRAMRLACVLLVLFFFLLDFTYFRHPRVSPQAGWGDEIESVLELRKKMKNLPEGIRIVAWDTVPESGAVEHLFLHQLRLLGRSRNWSVKYLGKLTKSENPVPPWKDPSISGSADVFIWHELEGPWKRVGLYGSKGSLKAYFRNSGKEMEILRFDDGQEP